MSLGIGRFLKRFKKRLVPGFEISLTDVLRPRDNITGPTAPLYLYGRWRELLGPLVPPKHYDDHGLQNMREVYPGKYDRQLVVVSALLDIVRRGVPGAVVEFGTFRGHTAIQIAHALQRADPARDVLLFDSFAGLPASPCPDDAQWSQGDLSSDFSEVSARFSVFPNVRLVKGFFAETLPNWPDVRVCFAHVDADLYTSTVEVNDWLLDRVETGGAVIYDDYGFANCEGVKRAVDEVIATRSDYAGMYLPTGQYIALRILTQR